MRTRPELDFLLKQVSRSFYLTLRALPSTVRSQIGLAYLLARVSDTIADTTIISTNNRLLALASLRARIVEQAREPAAIEQFMGSDCADHSAEKTILLRIEEILSWLKEFAAADQELIRKVLSTIISGQELDLRRFADAGPTNIIALRDRNELDDYTYRVAGCVGEFWTIICRRHVFPKATLDDALLIADGIRFGKGLQLVNILRDLPADLRQGRCYLPSDELSSLGLTPTDLRDAKNYNRLRPMYSDLTGVAESHLEAGWRYTERLPRGCARIRLACAWPILIGVATLAKLQRTNALEGATRVKVSRGQVRRIVAASLLGHLWPPVWRRLFLRAKLV